MFPARSLPAESAGTANQNPTLGSLGFGRQPPATTWRLRLDADLTAADGQTLGYPWVGLVETVHAQGFVTLDGAVWDAGAGPVPVHALNVTSITQWVVPVPLSEVMPRLRTLLRPYTLRPAGSGATRILSVTPDAAQVLDLDTRRLLTPAGTGIVWATVAPAEVLPRSIPPEGSLPRGTLVQVTNLGVTVKDSPRSTLVFVTRLDTGAPVPEARVAIVDKANVTLWRGTTDGDGVALAPALPLRRRYQTDEPSFIVTAQKDGDAAFVGSNWNTDASPSAGYEDHNRPDESGAVLRGSVFTDRGVYREVEDVHVKAVVREDTPTGMRLVPPGRTLDVVVLGDRGKEADRRTVMVSQWSSVEWTWRVPAGAALGRYVIVMSRPGTKPWTSQAQTITGGFLVAAFRRPDFRVDAALTADPAVMGSTLRGTVAAKYLFGGVLGARPVRWWFTRDTVQKAPDAIRERYPEDRYAIGYLPGYYERHTGEMVLSGETDRLAADGRTIVALPTASEKGIAYSYTFEGDVEDVTGQHIANRASLVVHPASLYVAMSKPPMFVDTKTATTVSVLAVDLSGRTVPDVPVVLSLLREEWMSSPPDASREVRWERREIPVGEWTVRTATGETAVPIPLRDGGSYILRATAHDAEGRQTRTESSFYALGPGMSSWRSEGNRIDLTPERETWKPGETARILVHSPWPRATGARHRRARRHSQPSHLYHHLHAGHRGNADHRGRRAQRLRVGGAGQRPDVHVLAADDRAAVVPRRLHGAVRRRRIEALRVDVSADREEYRPRQPVTVSVAVPRATGSPRASEVTLWAVDYGLLSLTSYTTPDVLKAIYVPKALQVRPQTAACCS